jgi:hypothetical protein
MANSKTLFDAVEAELRNARAAISNADIYLDMLKDAVDEMEKSTGMEAPLSISAGKDVTDSIVKTETGEYVIPLAIESEDETMIYGFKISGINKELEKFLKSL